MDDSYPTNSTDPGIRRNASQGGDIDQEISLPRLWGFLRSGKWKIAAFVFVALLFGVFSLLTTPSVYVADALIQIQPESSSPLEGLTSDLSKLTGKQNSPASSEISIIKSRSVLGQTVNTLGLTTSVSPRHFPWIGWAVASRRELISPASAPVDISKGNWFTHYAWKPARISVSSFQVPGALSGKKFVLRALGGGKFVLFGPEGHRILTGQVGEHTSGKTAEGGTVKLFVVSLAVGNPPTDFTVSHHSWLGVVNGLHGRLKASEQGENTGIVRISLAGHDRSQMTAIVNSVAENYLRQNVEAKSKKAEKSLEFLDKKLPEVKSDLDAAEAKLAAYREKNQATDLAAEGQALLTQASALESQRSQLKLKLAELQQTYTARHPAVQAAREQMQQLNQSENQLQGKINKLPNAQKHILRLRRDMEVNGALYKGLLNRAQELRVVKAGTVGNVRIIDKAVRPIHAVSPKGGLILMLSIVLGTILGVGFVFLQIAMRRGVDDPKDIENRLGLPVYAVVPHSNWLARQSARAKRRQERAPVLARDHGTDVSVEALRSLRTSLYFAQMEADGNVILITGPAPGVGKSFISANLAYLLAGSGKSVVVVDADMRRGRLHEFVNNDREPGLSQVLTGQVKLTDALRSLDDPNIQILTTGQLPPNPSELLMREEFTTLLTELKEKFDLVLIDAPPVLAVTDAAVIAATVPGIVTFLVTRAGRHPMAEIEEAVSRMHRGGRKIAGVVFNGYRQTNADHAGGYSYYQYEYKSEG